MNSTMSDRGIAISKRAKKNTEQDVNNGRKKGGGGYFIIISEKWSKPGYIDEEEVRTEMMAA